MRIFFIKQSQFQKTLIHIENFIENAFHRNENVELVSFDINEEIKRFKPSSHVKEEIIKEYGVFIINTAISSNSDFIFTVNGYALNNFFSNFFTNAKSYGLRIVTWNADDPYYFDLQKEFCENIDAVFTVESSSVNYWNKAGIENTWYEPLAYPIEYEEILSQKNSNFNYNILFIGTPFSGSARIGFIDRNAIFLKEHGIHIAGTSQIDKWENSLANFSILKKSIDDSFIPPVVASQMAISSKINLNLHKDSYGHIWDRNSMKIEATSVNERFFVLAGLGAFQLLDNSRDISFIASTDMPVFSSDDEFRSKIDYFLKNEIERKYTALQMREEILSYHLYDNRINSIISKLGGL